MEVRFMRVAIRFLAGLVVLAAFMLTPMRAHAQVNPLWDHYKVYQAISPIPPPPFPVILGDQFTDHFNHNIISLDWFMNPVEKRIPGGAVFPINDPILHYSWWRITPQPFTGLVTATNQFGDQTFNVGDAVYLLNPALKNQQGPPLARNHYKCYLCTGQPVNRAVIMIDQFDTWNANVTVPRYFCNPASKQDPTGNYPIVDPNQHYVCYEYTPPDPQQFNATFTDQFVVNAPLGLGPSPYLCVPTYKTGVTPTTKNTWGKVKMLYR